LDKHARPIAITDLDWKSFVTFVQSKGVVIVDLYADRLRAAG